MHSINITIRNNTAIDDPWQVSVGTGITKQKEKNGIFNLAGGHFTYGYKTVKV